MFCRRSVDTEQLPANKQTEGTSNKQTDKQTCVNWKVFCQRSVDTEQPPAKLHAVYVSRNNGQHHHDDDKEEEDEDEADDVDDGGEGWHPDGGADSTH